MALLIFIVMPAGWAVTGRLLGPAISWTVPTDGGKRLGSAVGRWCLWLLPAAYCALLVLGVRGDAGHGVRLFGSEDAFAAMCLPFYAVPVLGLYVLALYVIHDLVRGLRSRN